MLQVWGEVQIDGVSQTSSDVEVGMFLDDVCMASQRISVHHTYYRVKLRCNFDVETDSDNLPIYKTVTFKLFDHRNNEELECEYSTETISEDMLLGTNAQNSIVLNFVHETPTPTTYDITVTANPTEGGTVSGGGNYDANASVTLTASANEGYTFTNWTLNGVEVSTETSFGITVTQTAEYIANFESTTTEPEYPWTVVDPSDGNYNANLTAIVQINGELITDGTDWEVGAFCGDICRGIGNLENGWVAMSEEDLDYVPYSYYMMMTLHGNNGEVLSFKLANSATGEVHPGVCDVTVTYRNDGEFGDPWEPVILNFICEECYTLTVAGYGTNEGGYYLVASPIAASLTPEAVGMLTDNYDLYWFNQDPEDGLEWVNYKQAQFDLENGKGYLYASKTEAPLSFCGIPYQGDGEITLEKKTSENAEFSGWNLVGNPFPHTAYIDRPYYVMKSDGSEIIAGEGGEIAAMQGLFVIAEADGETMTFSTVAPAPTGKVVLELKQNRGNAVDRAIVRLDEGRTLPKFMLNENSDKLYIPQDDQDYAVVRSISENELPVNFKALQNGTYTLSVNQENVSMKYLHLIDHLTGADVNLLNTPNYQFNANVNDPESRFTISFKANTSVNTQEVFNPILYRQNGLLTIIGMEGESELEMIDMLGRVLSSTTINGEYNEMINATPGVYMIRLTNNDQTYIQKIVVK